MTDVAFVAVIVIAMFVLGLALMLRPRAFQQVAIRYSDTSFLARAGKSMVESDGYVGMLRALGAMFVGMTIVVLVVVLFGQ